MMTSNLTKLLDELKRQSESRPDHHESCASAGVISIKQLGNTYRVAAIDFSNKLNRRFWPSMIDLFSDDLD
jgi:hypothetical protein